MTLRHVGGTYPWRLVNDEGEVLPLRFHTAYRALLSAREILAS